MGDVIDRISFRSGIFAPAGEQADAAALAQLARCMADERAVAGALMADHHLGYSMPIGGVVAYDEQLDAVLAAHPNIEVIHRLQPIGVAMAGPDVRDPYKD